MAGALAACLAGALLAMPWILSCFIFQPEELPLSKQPGMSSRIEGLLSRPRDQALVREISNAPVHLAKSFRVTPVAPANGLLSREITVVDHIPPKIVRLGGNDIRPSGGTLSDVQLRNGEITARVRSSGWNLLVTSEPAWTGWRAWWNGERLPPVVVNHAFVGTFVPPGDGVVEIRYAPDAFDEGLRVAGFAILFIVATLVWPWYLRIPLLQIHLPKIRTPAGPPALHLALALGVVIYAAVLVFHFTPVAGGADSSGYANHARLWTRGQLITSLDFARSTGLPPELSYEFIPLGFVRGVDPYSMVPSYPPGLPLMMAAVAFVAGEHASFFIVAIFTALGVALMYALARAFGLPRGWSFAAAAMLAVFPTYLFMGIQPMTDSVAAAFAIAAAICALRGRGDLRFAAAAGALLGFGVLIRPTQFLLFPALLILLRFRWRELIAFGLGGFPFAIVQGVFAYHLYGNALSTGYGGLDYVISAEGAGVRFEHYVYWLAVLGTPLLFPGGLLFAFARGEERWTRAALLVWFATFFTFYVFYPPYETWWYTRFLLPMVPALIIGALLALRAFVAVRWRRPVLAAMLAGGIIAVEVFQSVRLSVLDFDEAVYVESVEGARRHVPEGAMLLAFQLSGAIRYYGKEWILVRSDLVDPQKFETIRRAAGSRPWFGLIADFELADAKQRAPADWTLIERYQSVGLYRVVPK